MGQASLMTASTWKPDRIISREEKSYSKRRATFCPPTQGREVTNDARHTDGLKGVG